jgi:alpha-beta hydrolase superfamily lysophospholipase
LPALGLLFAGLILVVGLLYLTAAYAASRWLTRPSRGKPERTPSEFGIAWEAVTCRTSDGLRLAGWVLNPPDPHAVVVLHHGLRCDRNQTLDRAVLLARAGYQCVAFDHRGHGESEGCYTSFGRHEALDAAAVLEFVCLSRPDLPRAAIGLSMGAAALCFAADQARAYDAVILESLYHDISTAFTARLKTMYPIWFRPLVPAIIAITEWRLGVKLESVIPAEYIGKIGPTPVLLLTGTQDEHADPESAQRLYDRCGEPKELWLVEGAHHADVLEIAGREYEEHVLDFLRRRLAVKPR